MNGCQYMRPTFTLPASTKTSDIKWDLSFLTPLKFQAKYDVSAKIYDRLVEGETLEEIMATYRQVR